MSHFSRLVDIGISLQEKVDTWQFDVKFHFNSDMFSYKQIFFSFVLIFKWLIHQTIAEHVWVVLHLEKEPKNSNKTPHWSFSSILFQHSFSTELFKPQKNNKWNILNITTWSCYRLKCVQMNEYQHTNTHSSNWLLTGTSIKNTMFYILYYTAVRQTQKL